MGGGGCFLVSTFLIRENKSSSSSSSSLLLVTILPAAEADTGATFELPTPGCVLLPVIAAIDTVDDELLATLELTTDTSAGVVTVFTGSVAGVDLETVSACAEG